MKIKIYRWRPKVALRNMMSIGHGQCRGTEVVRNTDVSKTRAVQGDS